ncbi:unnamed protein product [Nezara viridula]|uniref:Uncharacterized protein n=1 Tax=Nezara viridula TaxID=85310 RepID=A0A9P0H9L7_NEZVI|nr:unnamed protein product [Nezara viridula]
MTVRLLTLADGTHLRHRPLPQMSLRSDYVFLFTHRSLHNPRYELMRHRQEGTSAALTYRMTYLASYPGIDIRLLG